MRSVNEILRLVCTFLNEEKVTYVIVGGLAVLFYGIPRTTMDIDMIIEMDMPKIKRFAGFLRENNFFADEDDIKMAFDERSHATVEDKLSMIRLDIKGIYGENNETTLKRRRASVYKGVTINVASPEDIIANKLLFGSEQDIKDAEGIYVRQLNNLDMQYLEERCKKLDVHEEFLAMKRRVHRALNGRF